MIKDNVDNLINLGSKKTEYKYSNPTEDMLEVFENKFKNKNYLVEFIFDEFTSLCPKTGQPDFAKIIIQYEPNEVCIETKSLKMYFLAYRNEGAFMETITNQILKDLVKICNPKYMEVKSEFKPRGGTLINITASHCG